MLARAAALALVIACSSHHAGSNIDAAPPAAVANGTLAPWQTGPVLPTARANHCSTTIRDWVLVIGGNRASGTGFVKTDEIHAAQLAADGTLGTWQLAGHTHSALTQCNATSDGDHLYVIDGLYDQAADNGQIWTADLDATGHLGALASLGALPQGDIAISTGAAVQAGTLLLMRSDFQPADITETLRTPLVAGALAWATDDWHLPFRSQTQYAFDAGHVVALGGYHDPAVGALTDAYVAPIAGGTPPSVGAPVAMAPLPSPVAFGAAALVDGWTFLVGGRAQVFGAPGTTTVYAAHFAADGTLGAWQTPTALPVARTNFAMTLAGDYLVVTGGAATGPGDTMVLVTQVRFAPPR